jgi:DsbC/DsbD-like thiol-disulfide interchange protein
MNGPTLRRLACAFVILPALAVIAPAADGPPSASPWDGDARAAVRLVGGTPPPGAAFLIAGVEIRLGPAWKTYWRYPGDSGVPPRFDFAGSANVKAARLRWPAPMRFADGGGTAIGYAGRVVFPVEVERIDPEKPATLSLALDYAICERLCVPVTARARLDLPAGDSEAAAVAAARARVPERTALGDGGPLAIRAITVAEAGPKPRLVVTVAAPPGVVPDLFAEGPTDDWALPVPEPAGEGPDGTRRFVFVLDGVPPGAEPRGATLRLTLVAGDRAIETTARID